MDKNRVISKKGVDELEQMFEDRGYTRFALYDESRQLTNEGRLGEVLMEFIDNSPSDNLLPEVESVSRGSSTNNEFTEVNFILNISSETGPDIKEMGVRKHGEHLSVAKSISIKSLDDIPTKEGTLRDADALYRYASKSKRRIKW